MPCNEGHLLIDGEKFTKADIEYPFEIGINYMLNINTPSHYTDTGVLSVRRLRWTLQHIDVVVI